MSWSAKDIPSQTGRLVVVTGASGGLGWETASKLAARGADVVIAARDAKKAAAAAARSGFSTRFELLDLADLNSVGDFANRFLGAGRPVDTLINNAGLAAPPKRLLNGDGYELQFATNFLGHFALTARLLPLLRASSSPRVITVSSLVEKSAKIDFDDLMSERRYSPTRSYGQSKLANLLFARELQRRSDAEGWGLLSVAAHPGIAMTDLTKSRPGQPVLRVNRVVDVLSPLIGQRVEQGALPILFAAASPEAAPGGYYGPQGFADMKGPVGPARSGALSKDFELASRLWSTAERLTHINFQGSSIRDDREQTRIPSGSYDDGLAT